MKERIRIHHVAWLIAAAAGIGLSFSRLLGIHGPESALALGVLLTPFCAAIGARTRIAGLELAEPISVAIKQALGRTWIRRVLTCVTPRALARARLSTTHS